MTAVYIILGVLLLMALLLIIPLKIHIILSDDMTVKLKYLFIAIKLYPQKEKKQKKKQETDKKKESSPSLIGTYTKGLIEQKGVLGAVKEMFSVIKELLKPFAPFFAKMTVDIKSLDIVISTGDAAKTAIEYGAVCGVMYDILAIIETKCILKKRNVRVFSDFIAGKSSITANVKLGIRPVSVIPLVISLAKVYLNRISRPTMAATEKGDVKNG